MLVTPSFWVVGRAPAALAVGTNLDPATYAQAEPAWRAAWPQGLAALMQVTAGMQGGFAILQTPYSARLHTTLEDPGIGDDAARLAIYGQEDHVRLFGQDIFKRFEGSGLVADIRRHDEVMPDIDPKRYGVNRAEPLFLFHRI